MGFEVKSTFLQTLISNNLSLENNIELLFACFSPRTVGQLLEQYNSHNIEQLHHLLKTTRIFACSR